MRIYCDSSTKEACFVVDDLRPVTIAYKAPVTNNVGEYMAVIYALEQAKTLGFGGVEILTDSQLVVNQVKLPEEGGWKCRAVHLLPFIELVRKLTKETRATLSWVSREENLAGLFLDKR